MNLDEISIIIERDWKDLKERDRHDAQAAINVAQAMYLVDEIRRLRREIEEIRAGRAAKTEAADGA